MQQTKLNDYLATMSVYELNRFLKYINSPFYNEDERLKSFVTLLLPFAKTKTMHLIQELDVWKQVFGNTRFNRGKFVRLLSDTVKKAEHFLITDRYQQQREMQHSAQLEIMNERKLLKHIPENLALAERKHAAIITRDSDFYYRHFLLQQQKNLFLENKDQRSAEKNLYDVVHSLDTWYFSQKLKYSAAVLHYKNFLVVEGELPLLNEILRLADNPLFDVPGIQIYRYIILSFIEADNETHYSKLKTLLFENTHLFKKEEVKNMLVFAMNYCITRINYGKSDYLNDILLLYKYALQNDLLLEDGLLSQWDYKNIMTTALRVKDFKWAEKFLADYKLKLPKADRSNAYTFNLARYHFAQRNYDSVLQLLQDVKYNDIFYQLDSKTTLLKTYYELGEDLPLDSLKDSFRVLLRRKRLITPQQRENYQNLVKFTIRLYKMDVKDKKAFNTLKNEITATVNIADKSWLIEKLAELEGAKKH
jgi:hypothetical protein